MKQHEAVETTFSASRFESIRYLYDISMYIYREGAFDLHLLVESHRKIAEEL